MIYEEYKKRRKYLMSIVMLVVHLKGMGMGYRKWEGLDLKRKSFHNYFILFLYIYLTIKAFLIAELLSSGSVVFKSLLSYGLDCLKGY